MSGEKHERENDVAGRAVGERERDDRARSVSIRFLDAFRPFTESPGSLGRARKAIDGKRVKLTDGA